MDVFTCKETKASGALAIFVAIIHGAIAELRVSPRAYRVAQGAHTAAEGGALDWICIGVLLIATPALGSETTLSAAGLASPDDLFRRGAPKVSGRKFPFPELLLQEVFERSNLILDTALHISAKLAFLRRSDDVR
jgi:hypothetical protein